MKRVEVIANNSVEADLYEAFAKRGIAQHYTKIAPVHGVGKSGPRMGDHVWPEENFLLLVFCSEEEGLALEEAVAEVTERFPDEGIKIFVTEYEGGSCLLNTRPPTEGGESGLS